MIGPCMCGDTECPSCGSAQGTITHECAECGLLFHKHRLRCTRYVPKSKSEVRRIAVQTKDEALRARIEAHLKGDQS